MRASDRPNAPPCNSCYLILISQSFTELAGECVQFITRNRTIGRRCDHVFRERRNRRFVYALVALTEKVFGLNSQEKMKRLITGAVTNRVRESTFD